MKFKKLLLVAPLILCATFSTPNQHTINKKRASLPVGEKETLVMNKLHSSFIVYYGSDQVNCRLVNNEIRSFSGLADASLTLRFSTGGNGGAFYYRIRAESPYNSPITITANNYTKSLSGGADNVWYRIPSITATIKFDITYPNANAIFVIEGYYEEDLLNGISNYNKGYNGGYNDAYNSNISVGYENSILIDQKLISSYFQNGVELFRYYINSDIFYTLTASQDSDGHYIYLGYTNGEAYDDEEIQKFYYHIWNEQQFDENGWNRYITAINSIYSYQLPQDFNYAANSLYLLNSNKSNEEAKNEGYRLGYEVGKNEFNEKSYNEGIEAGIIDGREEVFTNPAKYDLYTAEQYKQASKTYSSILDFVRSIFDILTKVLDIEILPNIKLIYLVAIPIVFSLLKFILNLFK